MKKLIATLLGALIASASFAFAACDEDVRSSPAQTENAAPETSVPQTPSAPSAPSAPSDPSSGGSSGGSQGTPAVTPVAFGAIDGNYVEVAPADYASLFGGLDADLIFGDPENAESGFGLEYTFRSEGGVEIAWDGLIGPHSYDLGAGFGGNYKLLFSEGGAALCGAGMVKADLTGTGIDLSQSANLYNDPDALYFNLGDLGIKASIGAVLGAITGKTGDGQNDDSQPQDGSQTQDDTEGAQGEEQGETQEGETQGEQSGQQEPAINWGWKGDIDILNAVNALAGIGVKIYADTADGLKVKFSFDAEAALGIIDAGYVPEKYTQIIKESLLFKDFDLDVYFALDVNGKFAKAGYTYSTDFSLNIPAVGKLPAVALGVSQSGGAEIKAFAGEITLPEGLDEYRDIFSFNPDDFKDLI